MGCIQRQLTTASKIWHSLFLRTKSLELWHRLVWFYNQDIFSLPLTAIDGVGTGIFSYRLMPRPGFEPTSAELHRGLLTQTQRPGFTGCIGQSRSRLIRVWTTWWRPSGRSSAPRSSTASRDRRRYRPRRDQPRGRRNREPLAWRSNTSPGVVAKIVEQHQIGVFENEQRHTSNS